MLKREFENKLRKLGFKKVSRDTISVLFSNDGSVEFLYRYKNVSVLSFKKTPREFMIWTKKDRSSMELISYNKVENIQKDEKDIVLDLGTMLLLFKL